MILVSGEGEIRFALKRKKTAHVPLRLTGFAE
jgi:hypothetical protein